MPEISAYISASIIVLSFHTGSYDLYCIPYRYVNMHTSITLGFIFCNFGTFELMLCCQDCVSRCASM